MADVESTLSAKAGGYRIGFLNPWRDKAENQAFASLRVAADRVGHTFVHVTTSDEILAADLDFVIAVASTQPKLTHVPTFGAIHEPRTRFWEKAEYFENLLTYDGYLTISDSLAEFLTAFCAGQGKPQSIGRYYNTPQRQELEADITGAVAMGQLALCYFGTNWDPRSRPLFRALVRRDYLRIHGPEDSWSYLGGERYFGMLPFDGAGPQREYAKHGVGLALLSRGHVLDDVISNRIFEITSVGACAVCPDIPWTRKHFGDSVWYFDPGGATFEIAERIDAIMAEIAADPSAAAARAGRARRIFEEQFSGERLIENAVAYFEEWKARLPTSTADEPLIDMVIRVGSRPLEFVRRAVDSLEAQTAGRYRVIFARFRHLDLDPIVSAAWTRIEDFLIVDEPGADRAANMLAGLSAVRASLFGVLDDDDFLLPDHTASILKACEGVSPDKIFGYSGYIDVHEGLGEPAEERRSIVTLKPGAGDAWTILGFFAPNGFLASSALLRQVDLSGWTLRTAEDTLMILQLAARAEPRFSYRATACHVVGSNEASNYQDTPTRQEDVFQCYLRSGTLFDQLEKRFPEPSMSNWRRLGWQLQKVLEAKSRQRTAMLSILVLEEGVLGTSIHDRDDLELRAVPITPVTVDRLGESRLLRAGEGYEVSILPEASPWAHGAAIELDAGLLFPGKQWLVAEFAPLGETVGFGILDQEHDGFHTRTDLPPSAIPVEVWLHIHKPSAVGRAVVQNWTTPLTAPVRMRALWVVRERLSQL